VDNKIKYGFMGGGLVFRNNQGKTIAHLKPSGKIRWFYDPGVGIRQKIHKMSMGFDEINRYGTLTSK